MKVCVLMSYWYLSYPIYEAMKDLYPKYQWYFVDPNEYMGIQSNKSFRINNLSKVKNYKLVKIGFLQKIIDSNLIPESTKSYLFYKFYFYYERKLIRFFLKEKFDHIIFTSDWFHSSKSLSTNKLIKSKKSLLQPCFLDLYLKSTEERIYISRFPLVAEIKTLLKKYFFPDHPILTIKETRFGLINKNSKLYIWDEKLCDFYNKNNRKFTLIINPLYKHLFYKSNKFIKRVKKKAKVSILPANYSLNFGNLYQSIIEEEYIKLVSSIYEDVDLIIKIHPNESLSYWSKVFSMIDNSCFIQDVNIHDLILDSNYIVSTNSYSSIEATLLGTPCINLNPRDDLMTKNQDTRYSIKYSILNASNYNEVVEYILKYEDRNFYQLQLKKVRKLAKDSLHNSNNIEFV